MAHCRPWKGMVGTLLLGAAALLAPEPGEAAEPVRIAMGDVISTETLAFLIAMERAKERGLEYETTSFSKEELAIQAVIGGQADIGMGTPYAVIQKVKVPLRMIFQINRLVFFPVVANSYETWQDLDGEPFTFHARGTGTEAIGNILAKQNGIEYGQRSYVPGSENRIVAMMNGQIKASIVDLSNKNLLMARAGDRFHVLPGVDAPASDETVFGRLDWMTENREQVDILVEELLRTWRQMSADPAWIEEERKRRGLLEDLPPEIVGEVADYYTEGVKEGVFGPDGGGPDDVRADLDFYVEAGQLEGPAEDLKVEDFWYLEPLRAAQAKLGH